MFQSDAVTKMEVKAKVDLVWSELKITDTENSFKNFAIAPTDDTELNEEQNTTKFKHAMAGANIWNSLTSDFQIELLGEE